MARAFVAFQMEDRWARDFLVQHAKDKNNDIGFTDYSVHEPFDEKWKTNCKERIGKTKGTIVMVGPGTAEAQAVLWEIAETNRQQHPIFGVQINHDKTHPIPAGLPSSRVWDIHLTGLGPGTQRPEDRLERERLEEAPGEVLACPCAVLRATGLRKRLGGSSSAQDAPDRARSA